MTLTRTLKDSLQHVSRAEAANRFIDALVSECKALDRTAAAAKALTPSLQFNFAINRSNDDKSAFVSAMREVISLRMAELVDESLNLVNRQSKEAREEMRAALERADQ